MSLSAADSYLETQVFTATPQRLRLMLINEALRRARAADEAWAAGRMAEGSLAVSRARDIISELIGGIHPDETPVAKQVLGIYLYLFSTLTEAGLSADRHRLTDITRVLEEERQTWQEVCQQLPERQVPTALAVSNEELAPSVVGPHWTPSYSSGQTHAAPATASPSFSIDA
jgi:flagellar secretion chaperone FliS